MRLLTRIAYLTRIPILKSELRSASFACGGKTEIWAKIDRSSEFQKSELRTQINFWAACGHGLRVSLDCTIDLRFHHGGHLAKKVCLHGTNHLEYSTAHGVSILDRCAFTTRSRRCRSRLIIHCFDGAIDFRVAMFRMSWSSCLCGCFTLFFWSFCFLARENVFLRSRYGTGSQCQTKDAFSDAEMARQGGADGSMSVGHDDDDD